MSEPAMKTVYILRERFQRAYGEVPVKTPAVRAFATMAEARAAKLVLEREEIERANPFLSGESLADWTSLSEAELLQRLRRADMKPPAAGSTLDHWRNWAWDIEHMTPAQITVLRHALNRQEFYALEERQVALDPPPARKAYVVQRLDWQYNDNWNDLVNDEPIKAFRDRDKAEAHRRKLEERMGDERNVNACRWGGGLDRVTSLSLAELLQRLQDLGVPLPPSHDFGNDAWWQRIYRTLSRSQLAGVRSAFDRLRWYEVVEIEVGP